MICFAWGGFPQYAARCIGAFVEKTKEDVVVVATRPSVPIIGMEALSRCRVHWIDISDSRDIMTVVGMMPRVLIVSGWCIGLFNRFRDEVRTNGGRVIAMVDNNYCFSFRELLKSLRFRIFLRKRYDGFLVPGTSGERLLRFYGITKDKIRMGLYAADETLFHCDVALTARRKKMLFVGQLIERKNIVAFAAAFIRANIGQGWELDICGCGPLKEVLPHDESIHVYDFVQPEELAGIYGSARVFVLPSLEEHWGVVVHEAALSGCVLLLSNRVGASDDLLGKCNGYQFDPYSEDGMEKRIRDCMNMSEVELQYAQQESLALARQISRKYFAESVAALIS